MFFFRVDFFFRLLFKKGNKVATHHYGPWLGECLFEELIGAMNQPWYVQWQKVDFVDFVERLLGQSIC